MKLGSWRTRAFALGGAFTAVTAAVASCSTFTADRDLDARAERIMPGFDLRLPAGASADDPAPIVLLFHGCGGLVGPNGERKTIMDSYADAAVEAGFAAAVVDSFTPRNIDFRRAMRQVCRGFRLRGGWRAGDVLAAIDIARNSPGVDASRIALAGWSHGAWAVMDLQVMDLEEDWPGGLRQRPENTSLEGVQGLYLTYPFCGWPAASPRRPWRHDVEVSVVLAENDELSNNPRCREAVERARESGLDVDLVELPGLTHAFDEPDLLPDSEFVYNAEAAARARARFVDWLEATLESQAR